MPRVEPYVRPIARITLEHYAGPYLHDPDFDLEARARAIHTVGCINAVLEMAEADGIEFERNPNTRTLISGNGNGGFRPQRCPIGAPGSAHKHAEAGDIAEVLGRRFARWCLQNRDRMIAAGIRAMERPQWTPTWVHLQTRPVRSGAFFFIPDGSAPRAPPLPEEARL